MAQPRLRIYYGPSEDTTSQSSQTLNGPPSPTQVSVPLRDVFPILADAIRSDATWLRDFADDEISLSTDLYEVILAYQHSRRPSA